MGFFAKEYDVVTTLIIEELSNHVFSLHSFVVVHSYFDVELLFIGLACEE